MTEATEYTYEDAGRMCGVSSETIRHRAKRGKLRRGRPTNTGRPTVLLSSSDIAAISAGRPTVHPTVQPGDQTPGQAAQPGGRPPEESSTVKALASALTEAQEGRRRAEEALAAERAGRDEDRRDWTRRLDEQAAELTRERAARDVDRKAEEERDRLRGAPRGWLGRLRWGGK